jgi:hypothetical protein
MMNAGNFKESLKLEVLYCATAAAAHHAHDIKERLSDLTINVLLTPKECGQFSRIVIVEDSVVCFQRNFDFHEKLRLTDSILKRHQIIESF